MSEHSFREKSAEKGDAKEKQQPVEAVSAGAGNQAAQETLKSARRVEQADGYTYRQFSDGSIVIVSAPDSDAVGTKLTSGAAWKAITNQIGVWTPEETAPMTQTEQAIVDAAAEGFAEEETTGWFTTWIGNAEESLSEQPPEVVEEVTSWWSGEDLASSQDEELEQEVEQEVVQAAPEESAKEEKAPEEVAYGDSLLVVDANARIRDADNQVLESRGKIPKGALVEIVNSAQSGDEKYVQIITAEASEVGNITEADEVWTSMSNLGSPE